MQKTLYVLLIIQIFVFSCKSSVNQKVNKETKQAKKVINKTDLEGIWAKDENTNAAFYIKSDSMYFIEGEPVSYKLSKDTLITYYDGLVTRDLILSLTSDSLILINEIGDTITLYKRNI